MPAHRSPAPTASSARRARRVLTLALVGAALLPVAPGAHAQHENDPQTDLVARAHGTLEIFMRDPDQRWIQENIGKAKGVLIAPEILKGGFIVGGSGGRAVLMTRDAKTGAWNGPAFYSLASASIGLQIGAERAQTVVLVMTDRAVNSLMKTSMKLGGSLGIAAGPIGAGAQTNVRSDFVAFTRAKGIYGGVNLDGSVVRVLPEWNQKFYGKAVKPSEVLTNGGVKTRESTGLKQLLDAEAKPAS